MGSSRAARRAGYQPNSNRADDGAILRLFLAESSTLALLGALIGIGGGAGLTILTDTTPVSSTITRTSPLSTTPTL
jgi:ABC-type antimicrobial peptide transport system permease subunit